MTPRPCTYRHEARKRDEFHAARASDPFPPGDLGAVVWASGRYGDPLGSDVRFVLSDLACCPWQLRWALQHRGMAVFITAQPVTDHPAFNHLRGTDYAGANGMGWPVVVRADKAAGRGSLLLHELGHALDALIGGFSSSPWWRAVHRHIGAEKGWAGESLGSDAFEAFAEFFSRMCLHYYVPDGWARSKWVRNPPPRALSFWGEFTRHLKWAADANAADMTTRLAGPPDAVHKVLLAGLAAARRRGRRK